MKDSLNKKDNTKTYVWESSEVVLTGRTARKETQDQAGTRRARSVRRIDMLYEIEPANKEDGSWKKWVRMSDLYEIVNGSSENNNGVSPEENISPGEEGGDINWPNGE